nr:hypothetical protein [Cyanobacteria bacterium RUI128]
LGIDPSIVTSETQAQAVIAKRELEKCFEEYTAIQNQKQAEPAEQKNSTETDLIAEAKTLAEQLGIPVDNDATFDEITAMISYAIQDMMERAENDPMAMQRAQQYQAMLAQITDEYNNVTTSNTGLYSAMSMQANNTRYWLGL